MLSRQRRHGPIFHAIVAGLSTPAACTMACGTQGDGVDAGADADAMLAFDAPGPSDVTTEDAPRDSYVAWCEGGPPQRLGDGGCYNYFYVPCGLPTGDFADESGTVNRCDQVCVGMPDDICAVIPNQYLDIFLDAGLIDAATAATVDSGSVFILCACQGAGGRRPAGLRDARIRAMSPLATYFTRMAYLERASVPAFQRMRAELRALGAPPSLTAATTRAMADEKRHAQLVQRLATRFGGSIVRPRVRARHPRSIEEMAHENAVEGCVHETFAALVATWQGRHARDSLVRRTFATIARDEARHAELSMRAARFLAGRLDARARSRVEDARSAAFDRIARHATRPVHRALVDVAGLPPPRARRLLIERMRRAL